MCSKLELNETDKNDQLDRIMVSKPLSFYVVLIIRKVLKGSPFDFDLIEDEVNCAH